jgi:hypothetical protein
MDDGGLPMTKAHLARANNPFKEINAEGKF